MPPTYTDQERDQAMLVLALNGGNSVRAREALTDSGIEVTDRTLRRWRASDRYAVIQREHAPRLEREVVGTALEVIQRGWHVAQKGLDKAEEQLDADEAKDPAAVARNVATVVGIATDKYLILTGRPAQITESRDAASLLRALQAKGIIEGTAQEIPTHALPSPIPAAHPSTDEPKD